MKPGYKTTEFWLTFAAAMLAAALAFFQQVEGSTALIVTGALSGLYALLRASLKAKDAGK